MEAYVADLAEIVREATRMIAQIEDSMEVIRAESSLIDFVNTNFGKWFCKGQNSLCGQGTLRLILFLIA